ncbi:MAG: pyridoxamine 5'-phosphate oxidase family protein [Chloroflexi bacterium]|nr:pyridoxamine 5'-phosphate oxidase family protein [Chloroflexota bacterium]
MAEQDRASSYVASRPDMPKGYGILDAASGKGLLPWSWVDERMAKSRSYWIATTRPDGRPHVMPVWGVWLDGTLYFGTMRGSRKGRNLAANPEIVAHLESGDEAVIIEGIAEEVSDGALLKRVYEVYSEKYSFEASAGDEATVTYALRPRLAMAWLESDFPSTATRWRFDS